MNEDGFDKPFEAKPSWSTLFVVSSPPSTKEFNPQKEFNQSEACSHILSWKHLEHPSSCSWALSMAAREERKHQLKSRVQSNRELEYFQQTELLINTCSGSSKNGLYKHLPTTSKAWHLISQRGNHRSLISERGNHRSLGMGPMINQPGGSPQVEYHHAAMLGVPSMWCEYLALPLWTNAQRMQHRCRFTCPSFCPFDSLFTKA